MKLQGPYLQTTKTHLQRVLGDDNVLLVKFAEMSEENKSPHSFDHYCDVYNRIAEEGIMVGLRRYHFFGNVFCNLFPQCFFCKSFFCSP